MRDEDNNDVNATNDGAGAGDGSPDNLHFSEEELEAALRDFQQETVSDHQTDSSVNPSDNLDDFNDELQELIGNKAKAAAIITRLASADLLAAFCQISDISAQCIGSDQGAVAVLRTMNGDTPESAARDLTTVVAGMAAILVVNRADKLEATLYTQGDPGEHIAPPILFASAPPFVEDLMLGISGIKDLSEQGIHIVDTAGLDREGAMAIISKHTRFGRGSSHIR